MFPELDSLRPTIQSRLRDFCAVPRSKWQREIMLCLLTPQSSPVRAEAAMTALEHLGFPEKELSISKISNVLRNSKSYVRFHNVKAARLAELRGKWRDLEGQLNACKNQYDERRVLVREVNGFGWKEASHALRNIGRRDLSILDRHILRELCEYGVIREVPSSITEKRYHEIEGRFRAFADKHGEELDVLDLYFWSKRTGFVFK